MTRQWASRLSKTSVIGAVAVIGILIVASLFYSQVHQEDDSIKIAAILPLTGRGAHLIDVVKALEMATDTINRWGGIDGKMIDLTVRDSQSNRTTAELEFESLESSERPLIYFSTMCSISLRLASRAEESNVVLMASGVALENLTLGRDWAFRYYPKTSEEVTTILSIVHRLNVSHVGILYSDDMCTKAAKAHFIEEFDVPNGTVTAQMFDEAEDEYYDEIGNLTDTEAIVVYGPTERYHVILAELRELGYSGKIIGTMSASDPSVVALDDADGMYLCAPYIYNPGYTYAAELMSEFEERYGVRMTHRGAAMYDSLMLFRGLLEGVELTRENVRSALETSFVYSGLMGAVSNLPVDHDFEFPIYAVTVSQGELVYQW